MLVNGNLGTGVAVMGAFSLVRFRSAPGTAKEIASIFMAMAVGLATGTGYIGFAVLFTLIMCAALLLFTLTRFGEPKRHFSERELRITIPESLDYTGVFDDIFEKYTDKCELVKVKTSISEAFISSTTSSTSKTGARKRVYRRAALRNAQP